MLKACSLLILPLRAPDNLGCSRILVKSMDVRRAAQWAQMQLMNRCPIAGRFRITRSADRLVQLLHQAAGDAAASHSPALAQTLIAAVTDIADLAANLPPKVQAKQMQVCHPCSTHALDFISQCMWWHDSVSPVESTTLRR